MNGRSRPMILLPLSPLCSLDHNVPVDDTANSIIKVPHQLTAAPDKGVTILGTIDGVVLLVVEHSSTVDMILYNPFTRASKFVPDPDPPFISLENFCCAYGFGYGSSPKDLKVVEFRRQSGCRVFSFEDGSWRVRHVLGRDFLFLQKVGVFTNGFIHWMAVRYGDMIIVALDMTKMVFTKMQIPAPCISPESLLDRTREGRLCMVSIGECCKVDMWVMKEYGLEGSWSKLFSVPLISNVGDDWVNLISVLGNWKIVMVDHLSEEINIYDLEKETYKKVTVEMNIAMPWWIHRDYYYIANGL